MFVSYLLYFDNFVYLFRLSCNSENAIIIKENFLEEYPPMVSVDPKLNCGVLMFD